MRKRKKELKGPHMTTPTKPHAARNQNAIPTT